MISETHPLTGDPAFVDLARHDYHLTGDPAGVPPAPGLDRDGVTRPQGVAVDIGAYEWQGEWLYLPIVASKQR